MIQIAENNGQIAIVEFLRFKGAGSASATKASPSSLLKAAENEKANEVSNVESIPAALK